LELESHLSYQLRGGLLQGKILYIIPVLYKNAIQWLYWLYACVYRQRDLLAQGAASAIDRRLYKRQQYFPLVCAQVELRE
jgi:hypothetical protein